MKTKKLLTTSFLMVFMSLGACTPAHTHTADNEWHMDADKHWHECTAKDGAILDEAEHEFLSPVYSWSADHKCKAVKECSVCDYEFTVQEVQGVYVADTPATCLTNEKGHYVATFTAAGLVNQSTAPNSEEKEDTATGHNFGGQVTYTWNGDKCTASWECQNGDCEEKQTEEVTGVYVKDTDATCTENEKGHYVATFTVQGFAQQATAPNSVELPNTALDHNFGNPEYVWVGDECTATRECEREGCDEVETETVQGEYVKDTDASCTENEKGHYLAEFDNEAFEDQETEENSVEVPNTKKGHKYGDPYYVWNEDNSCTAKKDCECGDDTVIIETVDGVYVKDTDATHLSNEKGHFTATFTVQGLTNQATEENSYEVPNTKAKHTLDEVTGMCSDAYDVIKNKDVYNPRGTLTETEDVVAGFDKIYNYTDVNGISNMFTDEPLDNVTKVEFYISVPSGEFMFAPDDETCEKADGEGCYEIHPSAGTGTFGIITATKTGESTWTITTRSSDGSTGFKLYHRGFGGVDSVTFTNRKTLNELFHRPTKGGYGSNNINVSEVHLETKVAEGCGEERSILNYVLRDSSKIVKVEPASVGVELPNDYSNLFRLNAVAPGSGNPKTVEDFDLTGINEFKFFISNKDTASNTIQFNNNYAMTKDKEGVVTVSKVEGDKWSVSMTSALLSKIDDGSWKAVSGFEVENATMASDIFDFRTYSSNIYISDMITAKTGLQKYIVTEQALLLTNGDGTVGTNKITNTGKAEYGFGNKYRYEHSYNDGTPWMIHSIFNKTFDVSDAKYIEFYYYTHSGNTFVFDNDDGQFGDNDDCYCIHPSDGGAPGIIRAFNLGNGTWKVTAVGNLQFRNGKTATKTREFTYHNRTTLYDLFHTDRTWNATWIDISDIILVK